MCANFDENTLFIKDYNEKKLKWNYLEYSLISIYNKDNFNINIYEFLNLYFEIYIIKLRTKQIYIYTRKCNSLIIINDSKKQVYRAYNIKNKYYYKNGFIKILNVKESINKRIMDLKYTFGILNIKINDKNFKEDIYLNNMKFLYIKRMYD